MVFLALSLMALMLVTQFFTSNATEVLKQSNQEAIKTFEASNRLQNIVNLSFDLQSKLSNTEKIIDAESNSRLADSLTTLGYNANILLQELNEDPTSKKVDSLILKQLKLSYAILAAHQNKLITNIKSLADTLRNLKPGDKIYEYCLKIQKDQEESFKTSLIANSTTAKNLSDYTKIITALAILAIAVLATIIIQHQSKQRILINELKAAELAALESKNAKDDFLANMSHELRTPLNSLIGFGNLLQSTDLNPRQREYNDIIRSNAYTLLSIVNDVLDLSLIEAGKLKLRNAPFQLRHLFETLEFVFSISLSEKGLGFHWSIDDRIPKTLVGDVERLKQIFINLIGNAVKFTNQGGITLVATLEKTADTKGRYPLLFSLKDTGIGIPAEKIATIFERFEQVETTYVKNHGGAGLGLTIVKNLVDNMDGKISVISEKDAGTEFRISCPFEKAGTDIIESPYTEAAVPQFENYKILVVEDNKANQLLIKYTLERYLANADFADDGAIALHQLQQNTYDLVLMDIQMPQMDGFTALKKIREEMKITVPVIAMTAYAMPSKITKCKEAGFDDYISKPIEKDVLLEKLSKFLNPIFLKQKELNNQLAHLKQLIGDDETVVQDILIEMKKQWEQDQRDLASAISSNNPEELRRLLHRLRSTFSPLGAKNSVYRALISESDRLKNIPQPKMKDYERFVLTINEALCGIFDHIIV